jgi:hypothetical protein
VKRIKTLDELLIETRTLDDPLTEGRLKRLIKDLVEAIKVEREQAYEMSQTFGTFIYWNVFGDPRQSHGEALQAIKKRGAVLLKQYKFKYDPKWRNPRDLSGSEYA